ncbi:hypothetical protein EUTSA_v10026694mg [Eutrema salsugineum]|uniref:Uncharacterized protein n=1 Tax=Eutrema salsugineum TaxID=72664 RepID=V4P4A4_EUTSA|nr:hypothetical protein EUTSA_v10026694mg [Eutrema salsugineum]
MVRSLLPLQIRSRTAVTRCRKESNPDSLAPTASDPFGDGGDEMSEGEQLIDVSKGTRSSSVAEIVVAARWVARRVEVSSRRSVF